MSAPSRDQVFVSYSHRDKKWLDRLLVFLKPFQRQGLQVWADPYIQVGERWRRAIEGALERACIGVLLVSPDFLASNFIYEQELPPLKRAADQGHLVLICVPVSASTYRVSGLEVYQWPCDPEQPLDSLPPSRRNQVLVKISQAIHEAVLRYAPPPEPKAAAVRTAIADLVAGEGLGRLHGVPPQRPHYISRPEELARLKQCLLGSTVPALGITGTTQSVGVHGMGGIGKTVLAIALVNEEEVRRHFTDGVYWMTFGQNAALETLQAELLRALTGRLDAMASVEQGRARLAEVLADKACLLVLDDVWKAEAGRAFAALGPHGRMLLTTRDAALLTALGAEEASLEVMQPQAALALLAEWSGQPRASLPKEAEWLAEACGYLPLGAGQGQRPGAGRPGLGRPTARPARREARIPGPPLRQRVRLHAHERQRPARGHRPALPRARRVPRGRAHSPSYRGAPVGAHRRAEGVPNPRTPRGTAAQEPAPALRGGAGARLPRSPAGLSAHRRQ